MAILLLTATVTQAGFLDDTVKSEWFQVGGDFRIREVGFNNIITWDSDNDSDQQHFWRLRTRLFFQAEPIEQITAYTRLTNEWRYYAKPKNRVHPLRDEVVLDNAFLNFSGFGDIPLSLKVGRQDLIYGEGFLILDGTPLDGSRTIFSDAAKLTLDLEGTKVDFLAIWNTGKQWFSVNKNTEPLGAGDPPGRLDSQTIGLFGAYLTNTDLIEKQKIEAYYLLKRGLTSDYAPEKWPDNTINNIGGRFSGALTDRLSYGAEATLQVGEYGDHSMTAFGGYGRGTYILSDCEIKPSLSLEYVYLSGDDPEDRNYGGWDPILARWPKWSELYIYSQVPEKDIAYWTNTQIYRAKLSLAPIERMTVDLVYQYLRANEAGSGTGVFGTGKDRGQNPQFILKYAFNDWLSGHLWGEYFVPGNFYAGDDDGFFARWEMMVKF
jgi:hypothetical protein